MRVYSTVSAVTVIFTLGILCRAEETNSLPTKGVDSVHTLNEVYNRLVRNAPSGKLREIRAGDDIGIALQAAWEEVRRESRIPHTVEDDYVRRCRIDRSRVERFVAFMEGRLSIRVPVWWEELLQRSLLSAAANGNVDLSVSPKKHGLYYVNEVAIGTEDDDVIWVPNRIDSISRDSENLTISVGEHELVVPRLLRDPWGLNVASVGKHRWIVAMHSNGHPGFPLLCIDADTQNELWRADVWGEFPIFKSGAGFFHWVDFSPRNESVYVFGALNNAFYVEGFSLSDGQNLFRFSTSYCVRFDRDE